MFDEKFINVLFLSVENLRTQKKSDPYIIKLNNIFILDGKKFD